MGGWMNSRAMYDFSKDLVALVASLKGWSDHQCVRHLLQASKYDPQCDQFKLMTLFTKVFIWSLSIELRLECFVIVAKWKQYAKVVTYSFAEVKIQNCLMCLLL